MMLHVDLLGIPCAEYCERDGVRGVFIPEEPNFHYEPPGRYFKGKNPARAVVRASLFRTFRKSQKYDYMGKIIIPKDYQDAYMSNPNTVSRTRYMVYGYNWSEFNDETKDGSGSEEFRRLLEK